MTPESFAADIVDRLDALHADSKVNATNFIANKARELMVAQLPSGTYYKIPDDWNHFKNGGHPDLEQCERFDI